MKCVQIIIAKDISLIGSVWLVNNTKTTTRCILHLSNKEMTTGYHDYESIFTEDVVAVGLGLNRNQKPIPDNVVPFTGKWVGSDKSGLIQKYSDNVVQFPVK